MRTFPYHLFPISCLATAIGAFEVTPISVLITLVLCQYLNLTRVKPKHLHTPSLPPPKNTFSLLYSSNFTISFQRPPSLQLYRLTLSQSSLTLLAFATHSESAVTKSSPLMSRYLLDLHLFVPTDVILA